MSALPRPGRFEGGPLSVVFGNCALVILIAEAVRRGQACRRAIDFGTGTRAGQCLGDFLAGLIIEPLVADTGAVGSGVQPCCRSCMNPAESRIAEASRGTRHMNTVTLPNDLACER
jgi:hypothetical protein